MSEDAYAGFADLYDFSYGPFKDDLLFYQNLAAACDGPLLELGVGTGRVAIPLASAGFRVVGIDSSKSMLARARENASEARLPAGRLTLIEGDMADFVLKERFGFSFIAANTFQHLLTTEAQRACLAAVSRHLLPGGLFALAVRSPASVDWGTGGRPVPLLLDWTRTDPATGDTIMKLMATEADAARLTTRLTYVYDRIHDGAVRRTVFQTELRYSSEAELRLLLQESRLRVTHVYGDYDLTPVSSDTDHLLLVAERQGDDK
jgi:SAM-dependent methyltransferase